MDRSRTTNRMSDPALVTTSDRATTGAPSSRARSSETMEREAPVSRRNANGPASLIRTSTRTPPCASTAIRTAGRVRSAAAAGMTHIMTSTGMNELRMRTSTAKVRPGGPPRREGTVTNE